MLRLFQKAYFYILKMYKKLQIALVLVFCLFISQQAFAQTVSHQGYLVTSNANFSLHELEAQSFIPYEGVLNRGYGNDYVWLKLHVLPGDVNKIEKYAKDWMLRIRPTYLGEIALFDTQYIANPNLLLQPQGFTGQRYAGSSNGYESINHGFKIASSNLPRDIYLRLKTSTSRLISVDVVSESKAYEEDRIQLILTSSFLSILAFFVLLAVLQWLILQERLLALFVLKQAVVLVFGITNLGYMKMIFGEGANWHLIDEFVKLNNFSYVGIYYLFEIVFLSYFVTDKRYCRYAYAALTLWAIGLAAFFMGYEAIGLQMNMLLTLMSPAIFLLLVFKTRSGDDLDAAGRPPLLSRKILIAFYLFYILAAYLVVLPNMGIIKAKDFTLTLAVYVSIVSSALMTTLLMLRAHNLNRQRVIAEREVSLVNQRLEQEQDQRERQSQFISMLTHELKTPIGVAKLSLDAMKTKGVENDRIERALQNMNDVVERCRMSDALEGRRFQILRESFDIREAIFECIDLLPTPERVKVFEGNSIFIDSDSQLVSIVMANLLDNALKYSPDESEVTVRIVEKGLDGVSGASVLVTNLIGLAGVPDAERVFQKYYRAKKAEGKSGSGLGLYLTAGIADLLGGVVSFRSVDSRIEFELWLPN